MRVFVCEPLFKAYCKQYGRRLRTGIFIHRVSGKGDIILGNNVWINGKCNFNFAARFADRPALLVGDNTGIGHDCIFSIGKRITIGRDCILSGSVWIADSNGHPADLAARRTGQPPAPEDVRPVVIGNGVWIGRQTLIFPGVRIGDGSIISAGSVVRLHVPPYSVVAGNPAKIVMRLRRLSAANDASTNGEAEKVTTVPNNERVEKPSSA
jgi:acetyltransferase-like isoleucine patch superfamily enzyme